MSVIGKHNEMLTEKNSKIQRKEYIDIAKGLAMLSIIAGHMGSPIIDGFVYTYHVPLFLLVSGFFFRNRKGIIKRRIEQLLKPYLVTVIFVLLMNESKVLIKLIMGKSTIDDLLWQGCKWIAAGLYGSGSRGDILSFRAPVIGAIWFFLALIWATIFLYWIINSRILSKLVIQIIIIIGIFFLGIISARWFWLPFSLQSGMCGLLFLYIGYIIGKYKEKILEYIHFKTLLAVCMGVWGIAIYFSYTNDCMSLARSYFPNCILNILGAIAGSYIILCLCKRIEKYSKFLRIFGKNSLVALCFHLIDLQVCSWRWLYMLQIPYVKILVLLGRLLWAYIGILLVRRIKWLRNMFVM